MFPLGLEIGTRWSYTIQNNTYLKNLYDISHKYLLTTQASGTNWKLIWKINKQTINIYVHKQTKKGVGFKLILREHITEHRYKECKQTNKQMKNVDRFYLNLTESINYIKKVQGGAHMHHCIMAIRRRCMCAILYVQYSTIIYSILQ